MTRIDNKSLINRYSLTTVFTNVILAGMVVILLSGYFYFKKETVANLVHQETRSNENLGRLLVGTIWPVYSGHVKSSYTMSVQEMRQSNHASRFQSEVTSQLKNLGILRISIFNAKEQTVLSTEIEQIGLNESDNPAFRQALSGNTYSLSDKNDTVPYAGKTGFYGNAFSTFLPIRGADGKIEGILEIQSDVTEQNRRIEQTVFNQTIFLAIMLFLLFLLLFVMVHRLANTLKEQELIKLNEQEERIQYLALHDSSTGLPNRNFFLKLLTEKINQRIIVVMIGLDKFKTINDTLGHDAGDWLLNQVAKRLQHYTPEANTIFRTGGDQFCLVLKNVKPDEIGTTVLDIQVSTFEENFVLVEKEIFITASIGVVSNSPRFTKAQQLVQAAETAMFRAKELGRNHMVVYSDDLETHSREKTELEMLLKQALKNNEFLVYYQPKISTSTGKVNGMEALLRWNQPEKGMIQPERFISLLEENGLIISVGSWILHEACRQCVSWHKQGFNELKISVNLSFMQFHSDDFIKTVKSALKKSGLRAQYLELELTESALAIDNKKAVEILYKLKDLNVSISIDDFGTGYSSLSYLTSLPVDLIKIDRSFIEDVVGNHEHATLTNSIITMAKDLKLGIIAEGVESADQLKFVSDNGCEEVQGFLYSRPVPADEFISVLNKINENKIIL